MDRRFWQVMLRFPLATIRRLAALNLGVLRDARAVPSLVRALQDSHPRTREASTDALGLIGDRSAVFDLVQRLTDEDWNVRRVAAAALGQIEDSRASAGLVRLLDDTDLVDDPGLVYAAVNALGQIGGPSAVEALAGRLNDESAEMRWQVTQALAGLKDSRSFDPLIEVLRHPEMLARLRINDSLAASFVARERATQASYLRGMAAYHLGFSLEDPRALEPLMTAYGEARGESWEDRSRKSTILEAIRRLRDLD